MPRVLLGVVGFAPTAETHCPHLHASLYLSLANRFLAGVIPREAWPRFELVLWRTLRGNLFSHHDDIDELIMDMNTVWLSLA